MSIFNDSCYRQEDLPLEVSDSLVNVRINPPLIFKPVLAIVCNIARAHTVTHGRVNPRILGILCKIFSPLNHRAFVYVVGGEALGEDARTRARPL